MDPQAEHKTREPRAVVWLICKSCQRPLVPVELVKTVDGVRRVIRVYNMEIHKTVIKCPDCGTLKTFNSQKVKVGIIDIK